MQKRIKQWYNNLSEQSKILSYILIANILLRFVISVSASSRDPDFNPLNLIVITILMFFWSIVSVYALDCATKGGCDKYAWYVVYFNVCIVVIYSILSILTILSWLFQHKLPKTKK